MYSRLFIQWYFGQNVLSCRSCTHTTRSGQTKFTEGDLIKVPHTFKLSDMPHGSLVAQKKEFWGVIHAFTEPVKKWGFERVKPSERCVRYPHLIAFCCFDSISATFTYLD